MLLYSSFLVEIVYSNVQSVCQTGSDIMAVATTCVRGRVPGKPRKSYEDGLERLGSSLGGLVDTMNSGTFLYYNSFLSCLKEQRCHHEINFLDQKLH